MTTETIKFLLVGDAASLDAAGTQGTKALKNVQGAAGQAGAGLRQLTGNAAELERQSRLLAPQLTDIVVSLASGQKPLTVLLQQGGQIKDVFGGVKPALAAVASQVAAWVNPLTVGGAAIAAFGYAMVKGAEESATLGKALTATNNYVGMTEDAFRQRAAAIAQANTATIGSVKEVLQALIETGRFGPEHIGLVTEAIVRFQRATGASTEDAVKDFAKMQDGVTAWAAEHDKSMHFMTAAQLAHVRMLEETGHKEQALGQVLDAMNQRLTLTAGFWDKLTAAASGAWDEMMGGGRVVTSGDRVQAISQRIAEIEKLQKFRAKDPAFSSAPADARLEEERLLLVAQRRIELTSTLRGMENASAQAESLRTQEAGKAANAYLSKLQDQIKGTDLLNKKLAETKRMFADAAAAGTPYSEKDQAAILAQVRKANTPSGGKDAQAEYLKMVRETLANRAPRLADIEAAGYEASNRAAEENVAKQMEALRRRNEEAERLGLEWMDQAAQINANMITDERARGEAEIALAQQVMQQRLDLLAQHGADVSVATAAMNANITARQAALTQQLKPEWQKMLEGWTDNTKLMKEGFDNIITDTMKGAEDAFASFVTTGKLDTKSLVNTMLEEFARLQFRALMGNNSGLITSLLSSLLGGGSGVAAATGGAGGVDYTTPTPQAGFAKGGAFSLSAYSNSVVSRPTMFRFGNGMAQMGEAGEEGILPLQRDARGRLGVSASGGGGNVYVSVENHSGAQVQTQTTQQGGDRYVKLIVGQAVAEVNRQIVERGSVGRTIEATLGVQRRTVART